jgi:ParB/RepB/Spo0J family partition protein
MTEATATPITDLPLELLVESPFNPRRIYAGLEELAANIVAEGRIHEPLLVRPRTGDAQGGYELVFGHRRLRAAEIAGLASVPCMVRAMSDAEVRSAQVAENLQRADVHPFEEAEAFRSMVDAGDATADELAARFGKSRSYVYGRLKLLQACPVVRDRCLAGEIGSEVALLIARLRTDELQQKALAAIAAVSYRADLQDGGKGSYRAVRDLLLEKFSLELKSALFALDDATLLPAAGACTTCPKRTGNAPEFVDVAEGKKAHHYSSIPAGPDVCTDPDCFADKKAAHLKREAAALQAKGKTVIDGNKARAALGADGQIKAGAAYVALKDVKDTLAKAAAKGKAAPTVVTIQDPRTGKTVQAVNRNDLEAAGVKLAQPSRARAHAHADQINQQRERDKALAQQLTDANKALLARVREATRDTPPGLLELRLIAEALLRETDYGEDGDVLLALYGLEGVDDLREQLPGFDAAQLTRLVLDCVLVQGVNVSLWNLKDKPERLLQVAEAYGVPLVASEVVEEGQAPPPAARAAKKGKAKKAEAVAA